MMTKIELIKNLWTELYDPKKDVASVIEKYLHPEYEQCINGVLMARPEYINHVITQRKNIILHHIEYIHHLENEKELFALYYPKGKNSQGLDIEIEVIAYFQFQQEKIIKIHGQVRFIKGNYSDADMEER